MSFLWGFRQIVSKKPLHFHGLFPWISGFFTQGAGPCTKKVDTAFAERRKGQGCDYYYTLNLVFFVSGPLI